MADFLIDGLTAGGALALTDLVETQTPGSGATQKSTLTQLSTGLGLVKNNFAGTVAPTLTDDSAAGYAVGSSWLIPGTGEMWRARSVAGGAARWVKIDVADHPGYVASRYYVPFGMGAPLAGVVHNTATTYLSFGVVKERITISQLGARLTTASAGGNMQFAIYNHDANNARPSTLVGATVSAGTGTAGLINAAFADGQNRNLEPGNYWFAAQTDNSTSVALVAGITTQAHAALIGSTTGAIGGSAGTQIGGLTVASTFGTWPSDLSAASLTELTTARATLIQFLVASVP